MFTTEAGIYKIASEQRLAKKLVIKAKEEPQSIETLIMK